jgi:beta-mannosidase
MYNDCWGEVGWSIIDYYLRRKPSWYFVRRALEPIRLILRKGKDGVRVVVANDEPKTVSLELEYGYVSLDGKTMDFDRRHVEIPALTRGEVFSFSLGEHDPLCGLWIVRARENPAISAGVFRAVDYRQLRMMDPGLSLSLKDEGGNRYTASVNALAYAHAVIFKLPDHAMISDNYFDLLPGETRGIGISSLMPLNPSEIFVTCLNSKKSIRFE